MKTNTKSKEPIHHGDHEGGIRTDGNLHLPAEAGKCGKSSPKNVIASALLCLGLGSCVMHDDGYGGHAATYTTYQPGHVVRALPAGCHSEVIQGTTYYYQSGNYYRRGSGGYVVINAPRNSRYYQDYGRIRQARQIDYRNDRKSYDRHDQRYERRDVMAELPAGYRVVNHHGRQYYQVGERYYIRENGVYAVVSRPF